MLFVIFLAEYYQDVLHLLVMPILSRFILRTSYYSIKKNLWLFRRWTLAKLAQQGNL